MSERQYGPHEFEITIDLPFWLKIEGELPFRLENKTGRIRIETVKRDSPKIPGFETALGAYLVNDDTDFIAHTKLTVWTEFDIPKGSRESAIFSLSTFPQNNLQICNFIINSVRFCYKDYVLRTLSEPNELQSLTYHIRPPGTEKWVGGGAITLPVSAITNVPPSYPKTNHAKFKHFVVHGTQLTLAQELYCDARHYLIKNNARMSLSNLTVGFEVFLFETVRTISELDSDRLPIRENYEEWPMNKLATKGFTQALGGSLENRKFWGKDFARTYKILNGARNAVLHKGRLQLTFDGNHYDFADREVLEKFFDDTDALIENINSRLLALVADRKNTV